MAFFYLHFEYLLFILPVFISGLFLTYKKFQTNKKFNQTPLAKLRNYQPPKYGYIYTNLFLLLSFILLILSLLRPMWGIKKSIAEAKGTDIIFTLDVSKSMKALDLSAAGQDFDRLTLAKRMIENYAAKNPQNRYGLVIFAGEAFVSTPLTMDHNAFLTFLDGVDSGDIGTQGTDLGKALKASIDRFYNEQDKKRSRSIILISDGGEDTEGDFSGFAKVAKKLNINIFTIGLGSDQGAPIPEGRDIFGRLSYKRYQGKTVISKLNEKPLKEIARQTNGQYFRAKKMNDLKKFSAKLASLRTTVIKQEKTFGQEDQYQYFLSAAFIFFLLFIFSDLKGRFWPRFGSINAHFKKIANLALLGFIVISLSGCTQNETLFRYYNSQGNKKFTQEYYDEAKSQYEKAGENSKQHKYISENNYGLTEYKKENYQKAVQKFEKTIYIYCEKKTKKYCDQLYYNLGNAYYRQGERAKDNDIRQEQWNKAIGAYKKTLAINKEDQQAKENIDFILEKMKSSNKEGNTSQKNNKNTDSQEKPDQSGSYLNDGQPQKDDSGGQNMQKESKSDSRRENESADNGNNNAQPGQDQAAKPETNGSDSTDNQALDDTTNAQIDQYLKRLEEQEKNNQKYFQPNPNGEKQSNGLFDDFFSNDPFFNDFFNNQPFSGNFDNKKNKNKIDW